MKSRRPPWAQRVKVPTLDGGQEELDIPAGTQSGETFRSCGAKASPEAAAQRTRRYDHHGEGQHA